MNTHMHTHMHMHTHTHAHTHTCTRTHKHTCTDANQDLLRFQVIPFQVSHEVDNQGVQVREGERVGLGEKEGRGGRNEGERGMEVRRER